MNDGQLRPEEINMPPRNLDHDIQSFTHEWMVHRNGGQEFTRQVERILNRQTASSGHSDWQKDADCFPLLIHIFISLKKALISAGFYSFRKRSVETVLQNFINQFEAHILETVAFENRFPIQLEQLKQNFSSVILQTGTKTAAYSEKGWLAQWLIRPHFSKYKQYYESLCEAGERACLKDSAINDLLQQQEHPPTRRTLFQILRYHKAYDVAADNRLISFQDPLQRSAEEEICYEEMGRSDPLLLVPLCMQWTEYLAEQKTLKHYKLARNYLETLKRLLNDTGDYHTFSGFIMLLRRKYASHTSFIRELKGLDK